ncbi:GNAT family N-acetyltransferase [Anaerosolibacter sp.]|uniref:GNAT family N-acetyltransferase n=1 Tax=Anaerosolibacter sp. TaxID=1872527 RepID=UPI0039F04C73
MKHDYSVIYENIRLRPLYETDLENLRNWRNVDNIRKWFIHQNIIEQDQQLSWFHSYESKENDLMFIIEEIESINKPIGAISLYNIDKEAQNAEFGRLMIGEVEARGKGLGLTATKALCRFGFAELNLKEIYLEVFHDNKSAISIYRNAGFCIDGEAHIDEKKVVKMSIRQECDRNGD